MSVLKHAEGAEHAARIERDEDHDVAASAAVPGVGFALPLVADGARPLRRLAAGDDPLGGQAAPSTVMDVLRRRSGGGAPLPEPVRSRMGEQFGADLSGVRIHNDGEAHGVAQAVQSVAFTHGRDIYFSRGSFDPGSGTGQRLLAHELAHVTSGEQADSSGSTTIGRADDPAERAADRMADNVVSALRRSTAPPSVADALSTSRPTLVPAGAVGLAAMELRRWPWSKKKSSEPEETTAAEPVPTKRDFAEAVSGGKPADAAEARTRMESLRTMLRAMSPADRSAIATDKKLMKNGRTFVGGNEYRSLLAAVGTYHLPTKKAIKAAKKEGENAPVHMDGREADGFIRRNMGAISHLKKYIDSAVDSGKQAEGFIAVVSGKQWNDIYETEFDDEPVGSDDELLTNAYVATSNVDRPAIIHQDRGTRSTAIHESMHRYSESAVNVTYGFNMNEGITEYFTRLITDKDGNPTEGRPSNRDNYQDNWEFICAMLPMLGGDVVAQQTALAEIYFPGKPDLLKTHFETACAAAGLAPQTIAVRWSGLIADVRSGEWDDAIAELPPPPVPTPSPVPSSSTGAPVSVGG